MFNDYILHYIIIIIIIIFSFLLYHITYNICLDFEFKNFDILTQQIKLYYILR